MRCERSALYSWVLVILLGSFAAYPAFRYRVEEHAHDAATFHIYRAVVFSDALSEGWSYPRWVQAVNGGLGGPVFSFYPPLSYWLLDGMYRVGVGHPVGWRILVGLSALAGSAGAFALGLSLFGRAEAAALGAVCFSYAPALLRDLLDRGSPQGLALALAPWLLWFLLRFARSPSGLRLALAALSWAAVVLLHNLAGLLLLPALMVFLVYLAVGYGRGAALRGVAPLACGTLLAAFYVLPFLAERTYVSFDRASQARSTQPARNPLTWPALLALPPVFDAGLGNNSTGDGVGPLHALAMLVGLPLAAAGWRRGDRDRASLVGGMALVGLGSLWLQTRGGDWFWEAVPALSILQFRWRLLAVSGLVAAMAVGHLGTRPVGRATAAPLILAFIGLQLPALYPQLQHRYNAFQPIPSLEDAQSFALDRGLPDFTAYGELLPRWRSAPFSREEALRAAGSPVAALPDGARALTHEWGNGYLEVELVTPVPFRTAFHVLYFPGWAASIDGQRRTVEPQPDTGYILVEVPAGGHSVRLSYEGTPVQHVASGLSGAAGAAILAVAALWRRGAPAGAAVEYLRPRWWLLATLAAVVCGKAFWLDEHTTLLRRSSICERIPGADRQVDVWFGEGLRLCGYSVASRELVPGGRAVVTLFWQASGPLEGALHSFVHLLGSEFNPATGNPLWGQQDKQTPGRIPTDEWVTGKLYRDVYEFEVDTEAPPGEYQLEVGWWRPSSGGRVRPKVLSASEVMTVSHLDSLLIAGVTVR